MQRVLTLCIEDLLYATGTYSIQRELTPYNKYLLYSTSTYSMQRVLILYNKYLLYATTRIGVFACGQILCISPNGLQASRGIN